jgi:hypothetical protein
MTNTTLRHAFSFLCSNTLLISHMELGSLRTGSKTSRRQCGSASHLLVGYESVKT